MAKEKKEVEEQTDEEYKKYVQKEITINAEEGSTVYIYFIQQGEPKNPPPSGGGGHP